MPKYTFKCSLGHTVQKYTSSKTTGFPCEEGYCSAVMVRQMPTLNGPADVTETVDKYMGVTWRPDQKEQVKQRRDEFYWTVEVPRMVASGTYTVETMLENGWITLDDHGHVQVNNKPPSKR